MATKNTDYLQMHETYKNFWILLFICIKVSFKIKLIVIRQNANKSPVSKQSLPYLIGFKDKNNVIHENKT